MTHIRHTQERGAISGALIAVILLTFSILLLACLAIWLFVQYSDQKNNVDGKVETAVAEAQRDQAATDEKKFAEREKEPNREFIGPDDYGRLTFSYPKTWSTYIASTATGSTGTFEAYLNPIIVPPVGADNARFGLRVVIENKDYDKVLASYEALVKKGDLSSKPVTANGQNGTRLDGSFTKDIRGAVVIFKIRDKTVSIFTDADTFKPDFENIITTIKYQV